MESDDPRSLNAIRINETVIQDMASFGLKVTTIHWDDGLPIRALPGHVLHIAGLGWTLDVEILDEDVMEYPAELARKSIRGRVLYEMTTLTRRRDAQG